MLKNSHIENCCVRSLDVAKVEELRAARDYEELDMLIVKHLIG